MTAETTKLRLKRQEQLDLENAIIRYQDAIANDNRYAISKAYNDINNIYPAINFAHLWFKKYNYLYDTKEDFDSDYIRVFCTSLLAWKPKHLRKKNKYNGSGDFKNYFWSSLQNNYINMVKAENSGKRSISLKCPICDEWCMSLSTHLIKQHDELLWSAIEEMGIQLLMLNKCPFCASYKFSDKAIATLDRSLLLRKLKKHILSMHSNYLFEEFKNKYPEYSNLSSKPISIYIKESDDEEVSLYDVVESKSIIIDNLYASGLSEIQQLIVNSIFNENNSKNITIYYDSNVYKCKKDEFDTELEDLKIKLFLCGIDDERE